MTIFVNATINFYLSSKALTQFENRVLEATLSNALSERIMMLQGKENSAFHLWLYTLHRHCILWEPED